MATFAERMLDLLGDTDVCREALLVAVDAYNAGCKVTEEGYAEALAGQQLTFLVLPGEYRRRFVTLHVDLLREAITDSASDETKAARKTIRNFLKEDAA